MLGAEDDLNSFLAEGWESSVSALLKCTKVFFTGMSSDSSKFSTYSLRSNMLVPVTYPSCVSQLSAVVDASERHKEQPEGDGVLDGNLFNLSFVHARPRRKFVECGSAQYGAVTKASSAKKTGIQARI